jgi:hypothetical protein
LAVAGLALCRLGGTVRAFGLLLVVVGLGAAAVSASRAIVEAVAPTRKHQRIGRNEEV